jgi:hypothetical protein
MPYTRQPSEASERVRATIVPSAKLTFSSLFAYQKTFVTSHLSPTAVLIYNATRTEASCVAMQCKKVLFTGADTTFHSTYSLM